MPQDKKNRAKKRAVQFAADVGGTGYTSLKRAREYVAHGRARWIEPDSILEFIEDDYRHLAVGRSIESDAQAKTQQCGGVDWLKLLVWHAAHPGDENSRHAHESLRTFAHYPETGAVFA